jgi:hypothetical protein
LPYISRFTASQACQLAAASLWPAPVLGPARVAVKREKTARRWEAPRSNLAPRGICGLMLRFVSEFRTWVLASIPQSSRSLQKINIIRGSRDTEVRGCCPNSARRCVLYPSGNPCEQRRGETMKAQYSRQYYTTADRSSWPRSREASLSPSHVTERVTPLGGTEVFANR